MFRLVLACICFGASILASKAEDAENFEFFEKKVRPLLVRHCYECHSQEKGTTKGDLALDSKAGVAKGGAGGVIAKAGDPEGSRLLQAVTWSDPDFKMPPKHQLAADEVAVLREWIVRGLPDPRTGSETKPDSAKALWSLQPIQDPPLPSIAMAEWAGHPVDHFLAAKWQEKGLSPAPLAEKRAVIRRATFDLTGLPPTPAEVEAFLKDGTPDAFAKVVDRLLASPQYAEKWGRHWLDLVRYADTSGCNSDFPIPAAHKYRDYVIRSFMADKPYNDFLREQLAGDLLPSETVAEKHEKIIATGYLANARRFGSRAAEFHQTIEDVIDNMGKAFMGLSLGCARCHDHKFDPVTAKDYYALYGIFDSTQFAFPGTEIYRHPKDFIPLAPPEEAQKLKDWQTQLAAMDDEVEKLVQELARLRASQEKHEEGGEKPKRTVDSVSQEMAELKKKLAEMEKNPPAVDRAYAVAEGKAKNAKIHKKGEPRNLGEEVPRGFLAVLGGQTVPEGSTASGRRELAEWIVDPKNPLTPRVIVNRIWQHHFGKGIVQTPNDFGFRGKAPTHPELLDYLASKFVRDGWSIKKMHRHIMLSRAYQMSSRHHEGNAAIDNNNDYLWRFNSRRLSAEEVRDSILFVTGQLDQRMGGELPFPPEHEWRYTQHKPFVADYPSAQRSVYLLQQRIRKNPALEAFDGPDANATLGDRPVTTTPLQALFLMNSDLVHESSEKFAAKLCSEQSLDEQINRITRHALSRPATREELEEAKAFYAAALKELAIETQDEEQRKTKAMASYARVVLSSNEFLFVE